MGRTSNKDGWHAFFLYAHGLYTQMGDVDEWITHQEAWSMAMGYQSKYSIYMPCVHALHVQQGKVKGIKP